MTLLQELKIIPSGYKSLYDELPTAKRLRSPTESEDELTFCKIITIMPDVFVNSLLVVEKKVYKVIHIFLYYIIILSICFLKY